MDKRAENLEYLLRASRKACKGPAYFEPWHPVYLCNGRSERRRRWNRLKNIDRETIRRFGKAA